MSSVSQTQVSHTKPGYLLVADALMFLRDAIEAMKTSFKKIGFNVEERQLDCSSKDSFDWLKKEDFSKYAYVVVYILCHGDAEENILSEIPKDQDGEKQRLLSLRDLCDALEKNNSVKNDDQRVFIIFDACRGDKITDEKENVEGKVKLASFDWKEQPENFQIIFTTKKGFVSVNTVESSFPMEIAKALEAQKEEIDLDLMFYNACQKFAGTTRGVVVKDCTHYFLQQPEIIYHKSSRSVPT